jgi:hypothetical protein
VSIPVPSIPIIFGLSPLLVSSKSFLINSKSKLEIQLFKEDFFISYLSSNQEYHFVSFNSSQKSRRDFPERVNNITTDNF